MWDAISSGLSRAIASLLLAAIIYGAYRAGQQTGREHGWRKGALGVLGGCLFLAALAGGSLGSGTCEDAGDPLRGGCEDRADDGYTPSASQVVTQFFYVFFLLLGPTSLGLFGGDKRRKSPL